MHVRRFPASLGSRGGGRGALSSAGLAAHPFRYALIATLGVGCGMAILAAIAALSAHVVVTMRDAANGIDEKRSLDAVASAVSSIKKRMAVTTRDNAIWDDAYTAMGSPDTQTWIHENWGTTSEDYPLYDGVVVLDPFAGFQ